jgi:hypothetical protein
MDNQKDVSLQQEAAITSRQANTDGSGSRKRKPADFDNATVTTRILESPSTKRNRSRKPDHLDPILENPASLPLPERVAKLSATLDQLRANLASNKRKLDELSMSIPAGSQRPIPLVKLPEIEEWITSLSDELKADRDGLPDLADMDVRINPNQTDTGGLTSKLAAEKLLLLFVTREEALQNIMKWHTTQPPLTLLPHWTLFPRFTQRTDFSYNFRLFSNRLEHAYINLLTQHYIESFHDIQHDIDDMVSAHPDCVELLTQLQCSTIAEKRKKSQRRFVWTKQIKQNMSNYDDDQHNDARHLPASCNDNAAHATSCVATTAAGHKCLPDGNGTEKRNDLPSTSSRSECNPTDQLSAMDTTGTTISKTVNMDTVVDADRQRIVRLPETRPDPKGRPVYNRATYNRSLDQPHNRPHVQPPHRSYNHPYNRQYDRQYHQRYNRPYHQPHYRPYHNQQQRPQYRTTTGGQFDANLYTNRYNYSYNRQNYFRNRPSDRHYHTRHLPARHFRNSGAHSEQPRLPIGRNFIEQDDSPTGFYGRPHSFFSYRPHSDFPY